MNLKKQMENKNIIFMGTPDIAAEALEALVNSGFKPSLVITQKDKPVGRKQIITPSPVKLIALKNNIEVWQPNTLKDKEAYEKIRSASPDIMIVVAYGKIIPKNIIDIPKFGILNIHASLLPKFRGASPAQYAILVGEKETGVSIMQIDEQLDHGPVVAQRSVKIAEDDTTESLLKKLSLAGASLLVETLPLYFKNSIKPQEQDHTQATFTKIIKKEDGEIKESATAQEIERMARAFHSWPGVYFMFSEKNGKKLKVKFKKVSLCECDPERKEKIYLNKKRKLVFQTRNGCLSLLEVQPESKNKMSGEAFYQGYKDKLAPLEAKKYKV
ncbi:methionyl-tRNA formyltransferase [Candidatus Azambacteria bacterium]|nr:methionyl-tRNA formyltransferase [Candidatus Azambacteria bacterium]